MTSILSNPLLLMAILVPLFIIPFWKIVSRTGHSGWWSLLTFVPIVNYISLWIFAFKTWPAVKAETKASN